MARWLYRFNTFSLDPAARELRCGGQRVALPLSAFDCLTYLIEHRDRAIGRDELMAAVWGRSDVSDTLLSQTVVQLRHTLGDTRSEQQMIRTIPRFGYRWVAAVEAHDSGRTDSSIDRSRTDTARNAAPISRGAQRPWLWALVPAIAGAVFCAWLVVVPHLEPEEAASRADPWPSVDVAVLPVESSESDEWSWLRLGLMDLVGEELRAADVSVVPSNNIVAIARANADGADSAALVRAATGARHIVRPSVTRSAGSWIVHLELRSDDGAMQSADAADTDVISAGRNASDRLLHLLGKSASPDRSSTRRPSELLQQVRAALLTDNLEGARRLLDSAPAELADTPEVIVQRAALDLSAGDTAAAERRLRTLLNQLPREGEPALRARVLSGLGAIAIRLDRYADAEQAYGEAVALIEAGGDSARLGRAYMGRAVAASGLGRHEPALADFARARVALELAGDTLELARVEENEGVLDAQRGRHAEALQLFERAELRFQRFGSLASQVKTISNEIDAHLALLDPANALAASERGGPLLGRIEDVLVRHVFEYERARTLAANGRLAEAKALLAKLDHEVNAERETTLQAQIRAALAYFALAQARSDEAQTLASAAVDTLATGAIYVRDRARAWLILVRALRNQGKHGEAAIAIEDLKRWALGNPDTPAMIYASLAEAEQHRGEHGRVAARPLYRTALQQAERGAVPVDIAMVALSYGGSLIADGELGEASVVIGQVARFAESDFDCAALQAEMYRALGRDEAWRNARAAARRLAGERSLPGEG